MTAFCFHTHGTDYKQREIGDSVFIAPRAGVFFLREAFEGCSQSPGQIVLHRCHLPTSLSTKISMCSHVLFLIYQLVCFLKDLSTVSLESCLKTHVDADANVDE